MFLRFWGVDKRLENLKTFGVLLVILISIGPDVLLAQEKKSGSHLLAGLSRSFYSKAIDNSLYYSLNKINHKPCRGGGAEGICMFVWECMKSGGQHGGMCMDGFMFGSCCIHNEAQNSLDHISSSSPSSSSTNPIKTQSFSVFSTNNFSSTSSSPVSKNKIGMKPLNNFITHGYMDSKPAETGNSPVSFSFVSTTSFNPFSTFHSEGFSSSPFSTRTSISSTTPLNHEMWTKDPTITIKPPKAPTRPTRPPKPERPLHQFTSLWLYPNEDKNGIVEISTKFMTIPMTTSSTTTSSTTTSTTSTTTTTTTTEMPRLTTTTQKSKWSSNGPFTTNIHSDHVCGTRKMGPQPEGRIVNGTNSRYGEFPWQTSVRRTSFFGFSSTHRCGGALLNSKWVATAGHCVDDLVTMHIRLRVGEYDFSTISEPYAYEERKARKKVVHPKYNFFTYEHDLALVEMESPVEFQPHIQPICLPGNQDLLIGEMAKVTGWGRLSEHGTLPSILQQTSVPIMSNEKCKQMFLNGGRNEEIPEIFLCAGYPDGGRDSCQGDSGGPLQVKGTDGRWFLAGIISWGIGCAEPNLPGVCTRISKFVPFILEHVTR